MTQETNISPKNDPWMAHAEATEALIKAYRSPNGDGSLRDYVPQQRPQDPQSKAILGTSDLPANDPNRINDINRNTVIVTADNRTFFNPWGVSLTPITPQPAPRQVPTIDQVAEELESLKRTVSIAEDTFESDKANRPAIHARMSEIGAELGPLIERVRALEAELTELKAIAPPESVFTAKVAAHEFAVQQAAGHALEALQENWARSIFGISYRRNPGTLKGASDSAREDINLGLDSIRPYLNQHQVRFSRSAHKTVEAARETLKRLETNLNEVATLLQEKRK
jgi:hypothetical protein